jgi:hypothetical protein
LDRGDGAFPLVEGMKSEKEALQPAFDDADADA